MLSKSCLMYTVRNTVDSLVKLTGLYCVLDVTYCYKVSTNLTCASWKITSCILSRCILWKFIFLLAKKWSDAKQVLWWKFKKKQFCLYIYNRFDNIFLHIHKNNTIRLIRAFCMGTISLNTIHSQHVQCVVEKKFS